MRDRFFCFRLALASSILLLLGGFAEIGTPSPRVQAGADDYDARDFSGIYVRAGGDRGFPVENMPDLTPEGEAVLRNSLSPGRSRHQLVRNVEDSTLSNDPTFACNPFGFPRLVIDTAHFFHEVVMLPNRMLQLWQKERRPREIWLDGRELPSGENLDNLGPAWYGHAVGEWEGDTLVVNTVGMDDRAWLDSFGFRKSSEARVEERYRRVDAETLEMVMTLYDPAHYTGPWVTDTKIWKKEPRDVVTYFEWYGLFSGLGEELCAPMNASPVNPRGG